MRVGEAAVGHDPARLLVLRERGELRQELLRRALGRSSHGKEGAERLLRCHERMAVIVGSHDLCRALLFAVDRETEETLQAPLAPAHLQQPMAAERTGCQEMAQNPRIPGGSPCARGASQEAFEILDCRMIPQHDKPPGPGHDPRPGRSRTNMTAVYQLSVRLRGKRDIGTALHLSWRRDQTPPPPPPPVWQVPP